MRFVKLRADTYQRIRIRSMTTRNCSLNSKVHQKPTEICAGHPTKQRCQTPQTSSRLSLQVGLFISCDTVVLCRITCTASGGPGAPGRPASRTRSSRPKCAPTGPAPHDAKYLTYVIVRCARRKPMFSVCCQVLRKVLVQQAGTTCIKQHTASSIYGSPHVLGGSQPNMRCVLHLGAAVCCVRYTLQTSWQ